MTRRLDDALLTTLHTYNMPRVISIKQSDSVFIPGALPSEMSVKENDFIHYAISTQRTSICSKKYLEQRFSGISIEYLI
jgi:hypothetical protein